MFGATALRAGCGLKAAAEFVVFVPPPRRFSSPRNLEDNGGCFVVRDHNGQALAYVHFEDKPGRRRISSRATRSGGSQPTWLSCQNRSKIG
jgi:hypothetical protein